MTASASPPLEPPKVAPISAAKRPPSSPAAVILLYLIIVFIGAAVIAPHLYASAQFLVGISYRFSFLADPPFHRFVNRCLILLAILGLPSLFRELGLKNASVLGLKFNVTPLPRMPPRFSLGLRFPRHPRRTLRRIRSSRARTKTGIRPLVSAFKERRSFRSHRRHPRRSSLPRRTFRSPPPAPIIPSRRASTAASSTHCSIFSIAPNIPVACTPLPASSSSRKCSAASPTSPP